MKIHYTLNSEAVEIRIGEFLQTEAHSKQQNLELKLKFVLSAELAAEMASIYIYTYFVAEHIVAAHLWSDRCRSNMLTSASNRFSVGVN